MELHQKIGIKKDLLEKIQQILLKYDKVEKCMIFGSRARGDYKVQSDIDLCIYGEILLFDLNLIINDLNELDTALSFDVINIEKISKDELKQNIKKDGIAIYVKGEGN